MYFTHPILKMNFSKSSLHPIPINGREPVQSTADLKQKSQKGENRNSEKQGSKEKKDHGTMTDGIQFFNRIRKTEPFEDRQQAFRLLEA